MKKWTPAIVIAVLMLIVLQSVLQRAGRTQISQDNQSKIDAAIDELTAPQDMKAVDVRVKTRPFNDSTPSWGGTLKALVNAKPIVGQSELSAPLPVVKDRQNLGKKDDKKKKKQAKKKKKKKTELAKKSKSKPKSIIDENELEEPEMTPTVTGQLAPVAANLEQKKKRKEGELPQTFEEWELYILDPPNRESLQMLIKFYQAGFVSREIFYGLVEKMLTDKREQVKKFGLYAAGSTPSQESFDMLSQVYNIESNSNLKTLAMDYIKVYSDSAYVGLFRALFMAESSQTRYMALVQFSESATRNIKSSNTNGNSGRGRPNTNGQNGIFESYVPLLEQMATQDPDNRIKSAAMDSLGLLRQLLGNSLVAGTN